MFNNFVEAIFAGIFDRFQPIFDRYLTDFVNTPLKDSKRLSFFSGIAF